MITVGLLACAADNSTAATHRIGPPLLYVIDNQAAIESPTTPPRLSGPGIAGVLDEIHPPLRSTPPQPKFTHTMVPESRIVATDTVDVVIETADKVTVDPTARDRVAQKGL